MTLPTDWMRSAVGRSWGQVSQSLHQGAALFSRLHAAAWPGCLLSSHGYETQLPDGDHETQLQPMETQLQVRILTAYLLVNHTVITSLQLIHGLFISHTDFLALSSTSIFSLLIAHYYVCSHVHVAPSLQLCTVGGVHPATAPAALQVKGQTALSNHLAPNC